MRNFLRAIILSTVLLVPYHTILAATGGPDSFGYTWIDSNEPGGPVYNWIEIATPLGGAGTYRSALNCDDCHEANVPLGFNFPFYGTNFNQISIGSNGTIYFENVYLGLSNVCVPGTPGYTMAQYRYIAHLWDDLAPNYQGGIYTYAGPNYFVIEYYNIVPCCSAGDGDSWQVILFRNGNILMQYKELSNQGLQNDFTVGIQNNPTTGLQYKCEAAGLGLASGRAILWQYPGVVCPNVSQSIINSTAPLCIGDTVTLNTTGVGIANIWSTTETTPAIQATNGSYSVIILDTAGCTLKDTVTFSMPPTVSLGSDVTQCGGTVILDAANTGSTYAWSNGDNTQTSTVSATNVYSVVITDINGCTGADTVNITIHAVPVVNLGTDVEQCSGTVVLDAANPGATYAWSNGDMTQTTTVSISDDYSVVVTDGNGCSQTDMITVTIYPLPVVDLGADIEQCGGTVMLDAANPGASYLWNNGDVTQTTMIYSPGIYYVTVTDVNTCSQSDTIDITIHPVPSVDLGADIEQCGGTVILDAANTGATYLWSNGDVTQTTTIGSSGNYSVGIIDANDCTAADTINVTIHILPSASLNLVIDSICVNQFIPALAGGSPSGGNYMGTGVSGTSFDPSIAGLGMHPIDYVFVDANNCSDTATQNMVVLACLGIDNNSFSNLHIYPNPSEGMLYIADDSEHVSFTIDVINTLGAIIQTEQLTGNIITMDLGGLKNGVYFVRITNGKDFITERIILQK